MRQIIRSGAIVTAAVLVLAGCSAGDDGPTEAVTPSAAPEPLRLAVIGDSNTTGLSGTLEQGVAAGTAYVAQLEDPGVEFVGGWAHDGASSELMARQVPAVPDVDVLVVMAGTNDAAQGIDASRRAAALDNMARTVAADRTVLLAVPPIDVRPAQAIDLNAELKALAEARGWGFHDPWVDLRTPEGTWAEPYRLDGLHTNAAGYTALGDDMGDFLSEESSARR